MNKLFLSFILLIWLFLPFPAQNKNTQSESNKTNSSPANQQSPKSGKQELIDILQKPADNPFSTNTNQTDKTKTKNSGLKNSSTDLWVVAGVLLLGGIAFLAYFFFSYKLRPTTIGNELESTGRYATPEEVQKQFPYKFGTGCLILGYLIDENGNRCKTKYTFDKKGKVTKSEEVKDGVLVAISQENRLNHSSVEAGTGAGKTTTNFIPAIIEDGISGLSNAVIFDRKGSEFYAETSKIWEDHQRRVIYFNPWDQPLTHCFEPLWGATEDEIQALVLAHTAEIDEKSTAALYKATEIRFFKILFQSAQRWGSCQGPSDAIHCPTYATPEIASREDKLKPIHLRCTCRRHLCTLPAIAQLLDKGPSVVKAALEQNIDLYEKIYQVFSMTSSDIGKFFNGLQNIMGVYTSSDVANAFSRSDFILRELIPHRFQKDVETKTVLYVGISQTHTADANRVASVMVQLIVNEVFRRRDWMIEQGLKTKHIVPLNLFLDEIFSYAIKDFDDFQALARSAGCGIQTGFQIDEQAKKHYRAETPTIMKTNFRNQFYLQGTSYKTAKEISDSCGKKLKVAMSQTWGREGIFIRGNHSSSQTERLQEVPLITPDQIQSMPFNRMLVKSGPRPFWVETVKSFQNLVFSELTEDSVNYFLKKHKLHRLLDSRNEKRPAGSPSKHKYPGLDLKALGLEEVFQEDINKSKSDPKINKEQVNSFLRKAAWLGQNGHAKMYGATENEAETALDRICQITFKKNLRELNTNDAEKLMQQLRNKEDEVKTKRAVKTNKKQPSLYD